MTHGAVPPDLRPASTEGPTFAPTRRPRKYHGRRFHLRRYRPPGHARDRVRSRRRHEQRVHTILHVLSVPVLALVPAAAWYIGYPLNLVIAPALGVMGLVLLLARPK